MTEPMKQWKQDLKKDVANSGFVLEIAMSKMLKRHGWVVAPHVIYPSEQNKDYAESDIRAHKKHPSITNGYNVLVIECKKQKSHQWVFFGQDESNVDIFTLNMTPSAVYTPVKDYWEKHYYFNKIPCVYHFTHFVRKRAPAKTTDPILDAITSVLDALTYFMKQEDLYVPFKPSDRVCIFHPVVVLDGTLLLARIETDGTVSTVEQKSLQLKVTKAIDPTKFLCGTREVIKTQKDYVIDFVAKEQFEEFLSNFS